MPVENPTSLLTLGNSGSGKSMQIHTLPGRKYVYVFDPNSRGALRNLQNAQMMEFYPDVLELDATLKGFNKGAKDDKPSSKREPTVYQRWVEHINEGFDKGEFEGFEWICFDSLTFLVKALMARQLYINNRYGQVEDLADFKIVGAKMSDVFQSIVSLNMNIYATGHIDSFQDDKTGKIETLIKLPGRSRRELPIMFNNIWLCQYDSDGQKYQVRTRPDKRGLQDIRTSIQGLETLEDVTLDFSKPLEGQGVARLLAKK